MKKILIKGLSLAVVVSIMASGLVYADARIGQAAMMDDQITRIEAQIKRLENRIAFDTSIKALLDDKTDDEKVSALEALLKTADYDEQEENHIQRLIERYTVGEDTMASIREALKDLERDERKSGVQALIDSGNYEDEALDFLETMIDKIEENEANRIIMEAIRGDLKGLDQDAREEMLQTLLDSGDYNDAITNQLQKMLDGDAGRGEGERPMQGGRPEAGERPAWGQPPTESSEE